MGLGEIEDLSEILKAKPLLKPPDQECLSEAELREEITRVLSTTDPSLSVNEVIYSFSQGEFVPKPCEGTGRSYVLYVLQGTAIRKDGKEAKAQIDAGYGGVNLDDSGPKKTKAKKSEEEEEEEEEEAPAEEEPAEDDAEDGEEQNRDEAASDNDGETNVDNEPTALETEETTADQEVEEIEETEDSIVIQPKITKLANQFNFCERAALTVNYPSRNVDTQTVPPPRATFSATALQSIIYDYYLEDQEKEKEREADKTKKAKKKIPSLKDKTDKEIKEEQMQNRCREAWNILERLVNQNIYDDIAHDYRYWEDPSDEFRDGDGSLLPLWKFSYERMKNCSITAAMWNPFYHDLFAVAYGTFDFMNNQKDGCLCLFTIKNPSFPEYAVMTESPVISLDIHKKYPYLIVVGLYDGNVCVYNTQLTLEKTYQYKSDSVASKHGSLVWEVRWGPDLTDGECSFFSVSGDGRVSSWAVLPSELLGSTAISLILPQSMTPNPTGSMIPLKGCGTCITFHPDKEEIFLVGTEEGLVHKCSKAYSRNYLSTLEAHHMPVYRIDYNKYDNNVFATCSADWKVKIWEDARLEPLFVFDLGSSVGDVKWAPYSSTVFAAATSEGKVFVFDLNVNKYKPICIQNIVSKKNKKLTRIDFNYNLPIIICGDSKGTVHLLKLSPNLRVLSKPPKKQQNLDQKTLEEMKLAKLLSLVRDPPTVPEVIDEKVEED
ncbi:dynein intermediate chain 2, ciliary [Arctopsyche grandis]|uniref:dynein intermediate chain 2, ciliary n=1 Tax=Arctopsyche grandis TaxID=121162 RepID=UPI00406D8E58